jgi:hypothetical protein
MAISVFVPALGDVLLVPNWPHAGAPSNGTSGTLAGFAQPGDQLTDTTNLNLYINKGTSASPTWTQITIP